MECKRANKDAELQKRIQDYDIMIITETKNGSMYRVTLVYKKIIIEVAQEVQEELQFSLKKYDSQRIKKKR